jgi:hypothetical protein
MWELKHSVLRARAACSLAEAVKEAGQADIETAVVEQSAQRKAAQAVELSRPPVMTRDSNPGCTA